ncbi:MAG: hypothetical protein FJ284_06030 [Planctomycetes bacterium]|nr:hypothetical protein [Planctomycetota bacterium]
MRRHLRPPRRRGCARLTAEALEPRRLLSVQPWVIRGDVDPAALDDVIVVEQHPVNAALLRVTVNGRVVGTRPIAQPGQITILGGLGHDLINVDVQALRSGLLLRGGPGDDCITGGPGADLIDGGPGDDTLEGGGGHDVIRGRGGHDMIRGGDGDDSLGGGAGADTLVAGAGHDTLRGGPGMDRLFGAARTDRLHRDTLDTFHESKQANPVFQAWGATELRRFLKASDGPLGRGAVLRGGPIFSPTLTNASTAEVTAGDHSGTNNQVAGVEEADIVKTDGRYVYVVLGGELLVIDADPANLEVVSRTSVPGSAVGLFLHGSRVTVVSNEWGWRSGPQPIVVDAAVAFPSMEMSIGRLPGWWAPPKVVVSVFDLADPAAPTVVERTPFDGSLIASRAIGDSVYVVVQNWWALEQVANGSGLPTFLANVGIHVPAAGGDGSLVTIARLSPTDDTPGVDAAAAVAGMGGSVYASAGAVYLASSSWSGTGAVTTLTAFSLGVSIDYLASGSVQGFVPDQFAMDEHAGTFRVATQTGGWGGTSATSLHVLARQGTDFVTLGSVSGIAPREDLKSVRFVGDRAYVVTFERVDPLFAIDLSDPAKPRVAGELKIPGFSTYLHPMDEGRLFGVGTGDMWNTGKLSLFDVSDMSAPSEVDVVTLGGPDGWTSSEAAWDHHAFAWFPQQGMLAVPVSSWHWSETTGSDSDFIVSLFAVDRDTGFSHAADVRHDSPVLRSLRIADRLYTVSGTAIAVHEIAGTHAELGRLAINALGDGHGPIILL